PTSTSLLTELDVSGAPHPPPQLEDFPVSFDELDASASLTVLPHPALSPEPHALLLALDAPPPVFDAPHPVFALDASEAPQPGFLRFALPQPSSTGAPVSAASCWFHPRVSSAFLRLSARGPVGARWNDPLPGPGPCPPERSAWRDGGALSQPGSLGCMKSQLGRRQPPSLGAPVASYH
ncbi:hypothetical protein EIP86_005649, partial [Pleurotus ostreatoroseus]